MEGLKVADAKLMVYVHPSKAKNVSEAIHTALSSLLFKFDETVDGVVLAYGLNILGNLGKILPGVHPYFGARLRTKLLLFNPKPDMLLEGKIVKLSQQSIHVIVLGFSSATITKEDICEDFKYKIKHGNELYVSSFHKHHKIKVGITLRYIVKSFDEETLHICGSLLPTNTGIARLLHTNSEDWSQADSLHNIKKRRESEGTRDTMELNEVVVNGDTFSLKTDRQSKKSKRRRTSES